MLDRHKFDSIRPFQALRQVIFDKTLLIPSEFIILKGHKSVTSN